MTDYDKDVVAWSQEQAALLRAGRLAEIDIEHIAEEIEDVGRAEIRDFSKRMAVLLRHLIDYRFLSAQTGTSGATAIHRYRDSIERRLRRTPSLTAALADPDFWADSWCDAVEAASSGSRLAYVDLPDVCPWSLKQILVHDFLPNPINTPGT